MSTASLKVEVVHAARERSIARTYRMAVGSRVEDALRRAATDPAFAGVELAGSPVGIFGRVSRGDDVLEDGDRVEIYRPLQADPKIARRTRAAGTQRGTSRSGRS